MVRAIEDFLLLVPGGRERYLAELRRLALALYAEAAGGHRYFLDKTPRYHLVAGEIMELFPHARFVFLWRQPLAVAASMIESFGRGRWNLHKYWIDLFDGLANLLSAYDPGDPRALALRYEDLIADPAAQVERVHAFLGLAPEALEASLAGTALRGRMGDRTGTERYRTVSADSLERWRETMANPIRRRWCLRYLAWLGAERLAIMGYDHGELVGAVRALPTTRRGLASDATRLLHGYAHGAIRSHVAHRRRRALGGGPASSEASVGHQSSSP
jgi:hypothetical protein